MDEESRLLNREAEIVEEEEAMGQFGRGMWRYAAIAFAATAIGSFGVTYSRQFQSGTSKSSSASVRLSLAKEGKVKYTSLSTTEHADLFDEFKKTFGKDYDSKEEKERFSTFLTNLEKVDTRNEKERKAGGTAVHGITQFADISPGEFKKYYLGYVAPSAEAKAAVQAAKVEKYTGTAKSVNWANVYTTSINNQGASSCHPPPLFFGRAFLILFPLFVRIDQATAARAGRSRRCSRLSRTPSVPAFSRPRTSCRRSRWCRATRRRTACPR